MQNEGLNQSYNLVKDFHIAFNHPYSLHPKRMEEFRRHARYDWMNEELDEFLEAELIEDQVDAMCDLIYFALGTLVEIGVKPEGIFNIIHEANMNKLGKDGRPIYNEQGKVIKPEGWQPPEKFILEEILSQI